MKETNMWLFRHTTTDKSQPDAMRKLTEDGRRRAASCREKMGKPNFSIGYCSPLNRTRETLEILAGSEIKTIIVPELIYDEQSAEGKLMEAAFMKLGNQSVHNYIKGTDTTTLATLLTFGMKAWHTVAWDAWNMRELSGTNILVVGHAVLLGFMTQAAVSIRSTPEYKDQANDIIFGECEGVRLTFDQAACTEIKMFCD